MWFRDMGRYSRTATTSTMEVKPCALAPSPPAVFNVGHDARYIPHHEGYSTTAQGGPTRGTPQLNSRHGDPDRHSLLATRHLQGP
jgi:hypothetical protein